MQSAKVSVYSTAGNKVTECTVDNVNTNDVISVHSFSITPGIYTVLLENAEGKRYTGKVAIK